MVKIPIPNSSVLGARARRGGDGVTSASAKGVRLAWFADVVLKRTNLHIKGRVTLATHYLRVKVVNNISRPVTKSTGPRGGRVVTGRSKSGEFPKAETTHLMKTVFEEVKHKTPTVFEGYVGTPLDYGLILETRLNRSWLRKTLNEERSVITRILNQKMTP